MTYNVKVKVRWWDGNCFFYGFQLLAAEVKPSSHGRTRHVPFRQKLELSTIGRRPFTGRQSHMETMSLSSRP